jgi:hypothetical protein
LESADLRFSRLGELTHDQRQLDLDDVARIMADHGPNDEPSPDTLCMHGDYWSTTATLMFLPRSRRAFVAFESACCANFVELGLGVTTGERRFVS